MPLNKWKTRTRIALLVALLVLETGLVVSLRTVGWFGTGSASQLIACTFVTALPLIVAGVMLATNRFRFSIRSALLANNWQRFPSLQSVSVTSGVTPTGFGLLRTTLPRFEHLVSVHTNDVAVPSGWYRSLTNIRTLWVWGEGMSRGKPFPKGRLGDIVSLTNLETFMVLGYAFSDSDATTLSSSPSIRRVILRGTAVAPTGESALSDDAIDRIVYRN